MSLLLNRNKVDLDIGTQIYLVENHVKWMSYPLSYGAKTKLKAFKSTNYRSANLFANLPKISSNIVGMAELAIGSIVHHREIRVKIFV
jgi:hypothetical protein